VTWQDELVINKTEKFCI